MLASKMLRVGPVPLRAPAPTLGGILTSLREGGSGEQARRPDHRDGPLPQPPTRFHRGMRIEESENA